ncbi:MAG: peptidylprolyl isomerase [Tissierellia bacterium]|nr:peptidylprolyl isomerase [Tissierellia bacterium]
MMKKLMALLLVLILVLAACGGKDTGTNNTDTNGTGKNEEATSVDENKTENTENNDNKVEEKMVLNQIDGYKEGNVKVTMKTNMGDIKFILFPDVAPKAVENFTTHAKNGYYDGVIFHRVIKDFMIQGGDPQGTGMGGESVFGQPFEDEFSIGHRNFYGALSMANAGPRTNGSQFFIVTNKEVPAQIIGQMKEVGAEGGYPTEVIEAYEKNGGAYWLDGKHTVFGQVVEGMDVVEKIQAVETGANDKPVADVVIESISVEQ